MADFFPNWNFRGVFSVHIQYYSLEGTAKLRWAGGRAAPLLAWQLTQKDGCAHARPKPTSFQIRDFGEGAKSRYFSRYIFTTVREFSTCIHVRSLKENKKNISHICIAGQCRTNNLWPAVLDRPWCRNADAGLTQLTIRKNADAGQTLSRHSGIYMMSQLFIDFFRPDINGLWLQCLHKLKHILIRPASLSCPDGKLLLHTPCLRYVSQRKEIDT